MRKETVRHFMNRFILFLQAISLVISLTIWESRVNILTQLCNKVNKKTIVELFPQDVLRCDMLDLASC